MQIAETDNSSAKTWGGKTTSDDPTHFLNGGVAQLVAVLAGLQQDHQGPQAANEGVDPQCDGQRTKRKVTTRMQAQSTCSNDVN